MLSTMSSEVARKTAIEIFDSFWRVAVFRDFMKSNFTQYCYDRSSKYLKIVIEEQLRQPQNNQSCPEEKEPKPLVMDNFFPAFADVEQPTPRQESNNSSNVLNQKKKQHSRHPTQLSVSQLSKASKKGSNSNNKMNSPFQKLDFEQPYEQEAIIKQLRKQHQQKLLKRQQQENEQSKKNKSPEKKGNKNEKISHDYNGQVISVRSENRNNLIGGGLDGRTSSTIQKLNEASKNIPSTVVEYQRKKVFKPPTKAHQIQFTDIKTLFSQAKTSRGIKLSEGGITIEQKQKKVSLKELKETLTGRRLTKDDYRRIRQSTGSIAPFDDLARSNLSNSLRSSSKFQTQQNATNLRSGTQSKLSQSLNRVKSTITVSDPQLMDQLLYGPVNQVQEKIVTRREQEKPMNSSRLDSVDNYNLLYMKNGGSLDMKKTKSLTSLENTDKVRLPKIQNSLLTTQQDIHQKPKPRQKLKGQAEIIRSIRRTFDEKLRI